MAEENKDLKDLQVHFEPTAVPDPNTGIDKKNDLAKAISEDEGLAQAIDLSIINTFRTISENREKQYQVYDEMGNDTIISSALELYADNATEYNEDGKIIWAEGIENDKDGAEVAKIANRLITQFGLNETAWADIYSLAKFGDLYLETFRKSEIEEEEIGRKNLTNNSDDKLLTESITNKKAQLLEDVIVNAYDDDDRLEEYIERYSNPAEIFELKKRGKTVGFLRTKLPEDFLKKDASVGISQPYSFNFNSQDIQLYDGMKFVHIELPNPSNRNQEKVRLFRETAVKSGKSKKVTTDTDATVYNVSRGKSILYDIYKVYREKALLEDSILLNRVVRSALVRVIQVEVGDMGKPQVQQLLNRIKSLFEQKTALDKGNGMTEYSNASPVENNVYIPTRDGKGAVSVSNFGGDVNVGDLTDLDFFNNKLFAGIKIPKPFLGFMDDNAGFSGGESLAKVSSSFAKTIKRIQNAYTQGIKTLINIFLYDKGMLNYINKFEIRMVSPSTIEDNERNETLNTTTDIIGNIMNLFGDVDSQKRKLELLQILLTDKMKITELTEKLQEIIDEMPDEPAGGEGDDGGVDGAMKHAEGLLGKGGPDQGTLNAPTSMGEQPTNTDNTEDDEALPSPSELGINLGDNDAINDEIGEE